MLIECLHVTTRNARVVVSLPTVLTIQEVAKNVVARCLSDPGCILLARTLPEDRHQHLGLDNTMFVLVHKQSRFVLRL